jgi:hypothetical protein
MIIAVAKILLHSYELRLVSARRGIGSGSAILKRYIQIRSGIECLHHITYGMWITSDGQYQSAIPVVICSGR